MRRVVPLLVALVVLLAAGRSRARGRRPRRVPRARLLGRRVRLRAARAAGRLATTGHARVGRRHGLARRAHALPPGRESRSATPPNVLVDAALLGEFVSHAHDAGMQVVAWYLPSVVDVDADYAMMQRIAAFRVDGQGLRRRRARPRGHPGRSRRRRSQRPHRRSHEAHPQAPGQEPRARRDRLSGGADRAHQPRVVADVPVPPPGVVGRRVDADGVLHVPRRRVGLPRPAALHRGQRRVAARAPAGQGRAACT